jgi:hypothetical protein
MEIYIHRGSEARVQLRDVDASMTVAEAVGLNDGETAWLEDSDDDGLDTTRTVADSIGDRGHVHVNRCRRIAVTVNFNSEAKARSFPPGTPIRRVFNWATGDDGFPMSGEDRAEHTLQLCGTTEQPDLADHVGSFVASGDCDVCFDLVPKHRFEG